MTRSTDERQERMTCGGETGTECRECEAMTYGEWTAMMEMPQSAKHKDRFIWVDGENGCRMMGIAFCQVCGARLSFDIDGNPVARLMVPTDETLEERIERQQVKPFDWGKIIGSMADPDLWEGFDEWLAEERGHATATVPRAALEWLANQWGDEKHHGGQEPYANCPLAPKVDLRDRTSCPHTNGGECAILSEDPAAPTMSFTACAVGAALKAVEDGAKPPDHRADIIAGAALATQTRHAHELLAAAAARRKSRAKCDEESGSDGDA